MRCRMLTLLTCLTLSGCPDPHEYGVPAESKAWKEDPDFKAAVDKLPDEEKKLLAGYLLRAGMAEAFGQTPPEVTIGEAIDKQREFLAQREVEEEREAEEQAAREALAAEVEQERQAAIAAMNEALTVAVSKLEFVPSNARAGRYSDGFAVSVGLKNNTEKDMSGVKGTVVFADMFGDEIKRVTLSVDEAIGAGQRLRWDGTLDYNQFMNQDVKLRTTALDKMKISWEPDVYLFADGSSLSIGGTER